MSLALLRKSLGIAFLLSGAFLAGVFLIPGAPTERMIESAEDDEPLLQQRVSEIRIDKTEPVAIPTALKDATRANVYVGWNQVQEWRISSDPRREIVLRDVTVEQILSKIRESNLHDPYGFEIANGLICTGGGFSGQHAIVRCYDVRDLLEHPGKWLEHHADLPPDLSDYFAFAPTTEFISPVTTGSGSPSSIPADYIHRHPSPVLEMMIPRLLHPANQYRYFYGIAGISASVVGHTLVVSTDTIAEQQRVADLLKILREIDARVK